MAGIDYGAYYKQYQKHNQGVTYGGWKKKASKKTLTKSGPQPAQESTGVMDKLKNYYRMFQQTFPRTAGLHPDYQTRPLGPPRRYSWDTFEPWARLFRRQMSTVGLTPDVQTKAWDRYLAEGPVFPADYDWSALGFRNPPSEPIDDRIFLDREMRDLKGIKGRLKFARKPEYDLSTVPELPPATPYSGGGYSPYYPRYGRGGGGGGKSPSQWWQAMVKWNI